MNFGALDKFPVMQNTMQAAFKPCSKTILLCAKIYQRYWAHIQLFCNCGIKTDERQTSFEVARVIGNDSGIVTDPACCPCEPRRDGVGVTQGVTVLSQCCQP